MLFSLKWVARAFRLYAPTPLEQSRPASSLNGSGSVKLGMDTPPETLVTRTAPVHPDKLVLPQSVVQCSSAKPDIAKDPTSERRRSLEDEKRAVPMLLCRICEVRIAADKMLVMLGSHF